ncbi:hypothetical protein ACRALDRAFT_1083544 [Sodiomyces alcalophilus JCM 7366]|uniref:uncharacterized protein n=1 Tax=Sodiomyces alcalophilus JCM 7366 TaxID=591952 RepID=UPI0039B3E172
MSSPPSDSQEPPLGRTDSDNSNEAPPLPPAPSPSSDSNLVDIAANLARSKARYEEVWRMTPHAAMKVLATTSDALARSTGEIPSPPSSVSVKTHHMRGMQWERDNIKRPHSEKELALMREKAEAQAKAETAAASAAVTAELPIRQAPSRDASLTPGPIDGIRLRPKASTFVDHPPPRARKDKVIVGNTKPTKEQRDAILRRFYCRKVPDTSVEEYLDRLHKYCPMSTGVYLATSLYIHRLAVEDRTIYVTPRTVHRTLLAALRLSTKALEDYRYSNHKMARVGGVTEHELLHLEVGFGLIISFELFVRDSDLAAHLDVLRRETPANLLLQAFPPLRPDPGAKEKPTSPGDEPEGHGEGQAAEPQ